MDNLEIGKPVFVLLLRFDLFTIVREMHLRILAESGAGVASLTEFLRELSTKHLREGLQPLGSGPDSQLARLEFYM